ncbi:histone-lysine N-methyltransferase PRDM9-like [Huso huso]|uniref:Histone-lysine N-methyltransferase PRDM9-like n=1 Tax=Huso huso TaxID=61971 RepID=A0ABR1A5A6_HUSHU
MLSFISDCNICHSFFLDKCNIHGPPVFIKNPLVEIGVANRARLTLPQGMIIKVSKIPNAGLGVWNERRVIPNSIHFGPYEGELTSEKEAALSGYSWMIRKGNSDHEYLDAKNEANSNWMRYVNCARNDEEQNLVAFQYKGQIFYRSCKPIPPGCELLVWYGDEYGKELGVGLDFMWERSIEKDVEKHKLHTCHHCGASFTAKHYLEDHEKKTHPREEILRTTENSQASHSTECGSSFSRIDNVKIRQRLCTGDKPHTCVECDRSSNKTEQAILKKQTILDMFSISPTCGNQGSLHCCQKWIEFKPMSIK